MTAVLIPSHLPKIIVKITGGINVEDEEFHGDLTFQTFIKQGPWFRPFPMSSCPGLSPLQKKLGIILLEGVTFVEESLN